MIYVRRSSKSFYENLEINTYILEYEKIIKEMEIILKNINEEKEEISEHLLNIIKHEKNNKIKKKLFELRRKIYNTVEPYEIKDEFINLKIRNDIFNRKKLIKCTNKMEELLQINTIKIKKLLMKN